MSAPVLRLIWVVLFALGLVGTTWVANSMLIRHCLFSIDTVPTDCWSLLLAKEDSWPEDLIIATEEPKGPIARWLDDLLKGRAD